VNVGAMKRPMEPPPAPSSSVARRRLNHGEPSSIDDDSWLLGNILSYDQHKGYGFIDSPGVPEGDIYFQRAAMPSEAQARLKGQVRGLEVEFIVFFTPDGKPRARKVRLLAGARALPSTPPPASRSQEALGALPPPPLHADMVEKMTQFLEDTGGTMDFGKFTREFKGFKKQQLEPHFVLTPEDDDAGGRWQISLSGASPHPLPRPPPRPDREPARAQPDNSEDVLMGRFEGTIALFDSFKGYGFIKSDEVAEGDVYFKRTELPLEAQSYPRGRLVGAKVEFDAMLTSHGKARGERVRLLDEPSQADNPDAQMNGQAARERREPPEVPTIPLSDEAVNEMTQFLEDHDGAMDYGKFANAFTGVKKMQLENHFTLVPESQDAGGRWQITLPGIDPLPPAEDREERPNPYPRPRPRSPRPRSPRPRSPRPRSRSPGPERLPRPSSSRPSQVRARIEPSPNLWLIGCIKKWDQRKGFGFLVADGADDVFVHRNDLPQELQAITSNLQGAEFAFELEVGDNGKLRARQLRALLTPDFRDGGWMLRRA